MTSRRWLMALVLAIGLLGMHGIAASTASAATPCGATMPHEHHGMSVPAEAGPTALGPQASAPMVDSGHAGALCLAVLAVGLLLALLVQRRARDHVATPADRRATALAAHGRAPPRPSLPLLCVLRT